MVQVLDGLEASAKAAEGLVYSWQKLGRDDEARALAASWAGKIPS